MVSRAEITGYDSISPEVEEVPLRTRLVLPLHLHGPHEPAHTTRAALIRVYLGQEEVSQELNMVLRVGGEVSIVNVAYVRRVEGVIGGHIATLKH